MAEYGPPPQGQCFITDYFKKKERDSVRLLPGIQKKRGRSIQLKLTDFYNRCHEEQLIVKHSECQPYALRAFDIPSGTKKLRFSYFVSKVEGGNGNGWKNSTILIKDYPNRNSSFQKLRRVQKFHLKMKHKCRPATIKRLRIANHVLSRILQENSTQTDS